MACETSKETSVITAVNSCDLNFDVKSHSTPLMQSNTVCSSSANSQIAVNTHARSSELTNNLASTEKIKSEVSSQLPITQPLLSSETTTQETTNTDSLLTGNIPFTDTQCSHSSTLFDVIPTSPVSSVSTSIVSSLSSSQPQASIFNTSSHVASESKANMIPPITTNTAPTLTKSAFEFGQSPPTNTSISPNGMYTYSQNTVQTSNTLDANQQLSIQSATPTTTPPATSVVATNSASNTNNNSNNIAAVNSSPVTTSTITIPTSQPNVFGSSSNANQPVNQPKRLHVSNIPFRFRDPDLRSLFGVSKF